MRQKHRRPANFPRPNGWALAPQLLFGVFLVVFALARFGWALTALIILLAALGCGLLVGTYWWVDTRRHAEDDRGWRLSASTLWITASGERRTGRGHIGVDGFRWEPRLIPDGPTTAFSLSWHTITTVDVSRKAPLTSNVQITTSDGETFNLVMQAGPSTVQGALQDRPIS